MKKIFTLLVGFFFLNLNVVYSQCTPVDCSASLPPYGGICDTILLEGVVNTAYIDFESFHITTACFDAGLISPSNAGTGIKITSLHAFSFYPNYALEKI